MKIFYRFRRTILGTLVAAIITISMLGFGVDLYNTRNTKSYAIKIGKTSITHDEFYNQKRNLEQRYRSIFGNEYQKILSMTGKNMNQMVVDNLVSQTILDQTASNFGLAGNDTEVAKKILRELFPNGYNEAVYKNFLSSRNMSSTQFEAEVKNDMKREQISAIISDFVSPSKKEILSLARQNKVKYKVNSATFDPKDFVAKVPEITDDEMKNFYESHSSEYEIPARASYDYFIVEDKHFPNLVQISQPDIELYYTDHQNEFKTEEERRLSLIKLPVSKDTKEEDKKLLKQKISELKEKIKKGEKFEDLARTSSEDVTTKEKGGDYGWVKKGATELPLLVVNSVFELKPESEPKEVYDDANGYFLVKLTEIKSPVVKPLDEVRSIIDEKLKKEELPAYLSAKASELYDQLAKANVPLADFLKGQNLPVASTNGLLEENTDPEIKVSGLTAKILEVPDQLIQLVELKGANVIVGLKETKTQEIPKIEVVKDKVAERIKEEKSRKLAQEAAENFLKDFKENKYPDLKIGAQTVNAKFIEHTEFSKEQPPADIQSRQAIEKITSTTLANLLLPKVYDNAGQFAVYQVASLIPPKDEEISKDMESLEKSIKDEDNNLALNSIIESIKIKMERDVDPNILARE